MVLKYSEDGYPYHEPPYDEEEMAVLIRAASGPPIAIYRRRETPDTGSKPQAAPGSEVKPSQPPERP